MMGNPSRGRRRGASLLEVMIAATVMLFITGVLVSFIRLDSLVWHAGISSHDSQSAGRMAAQRMAATLRAARRILPAQSSATRVTLQMPAYDANGNLIVPMEDGDVISFYLSDGSGSPDQPGSILWRSVNGAPDTEWSLRQAAGGSEGRVDLAPDGLGFTYVPDLNAVDGPESVTVQVTATRTSGSHTRDYVTTQEVMLRNRGL